jgi:uncharacterized membrane protein YbhN (UPF0104 family)
MQKIRSISKALISLGLLGLLASFLDWPRALDLLGDTPLSDFILALGFLLAAYLANGFRLARIQQRAGVQVPATLFLGTYYAGLAFNNILPSGVGGDAVRVMILTKRGYPLGTLVFSTLADRFLGLLGLFVIGGLAMLAAPSALHATPLDGRMIGSLLLLVSLVCLWWLPGLLGFLLGRLARRPGSRWGEGIARSHALIGRTLQPPRRVTDLLLLSLASHAFVVLSYASCGASLLPEMTLAHYFIAIPGVMLLLVLPISLGGLGLREISTVGLLVWLGADAQAALTLSLVFLLISWVSVIPGFFGAVHYGFNAFASKDRMHES